MPKFARFTISTPTRHPANLKAYDPIFHRYKPDYVNPAFWVLNLIAIPPGLHESIADESFLSSMELLKSLDEKVKKAVIPNEILTFVWTVKQVGGSFSRTIPKLRSPSMWRTEVQVPKPGEYEVTLQVNLTGGQREVSSRNYLLRDFLVVSIGDSFASGQGNPDVVAVPSPDQKAICEATTLTLFITKIEGAIKEFAEQLKVKTEESIEKYLPFIGAIVVAEINNVEDVVGFVKNAAESVASAVVDVARDIGGGVVEGAEEVASWFGLGDGGESDEIDPHPAGWQEPNAYRSYRSGHSLAARQVESETPFSADRITFISLGRSGSEIDDGLLGPRTVDVPLDSANKAIDGWTKNRGQIQEAKETVLNRPIDALIITIGVNDLGFSSQVTQAILWKSGEKRKERIASVKKKLETEYPQLLNQLKRAIDSQLRPRQVFILEYPVRIFKEVAERGPCGVLGSSVGLNLDKADARSLGELGDLLNQKIRAKADEFGWILVDGIENGFDGHGYCASRPYFVLAEESCRNQGDFEGMLHPNKLGQQVTRDCIVRALRREMLTPQESWLEPVLNVMMS